MICAYVYLPCMRVYLYILLIVYLPIYTYTYYIYYHIIHTQETLGLSYNPPTSTLTATTPSPTSTNNIHLQFTQKSQQKYESHLISLFSTAISGLRTVPLPSHIAHIKLTDNDTTPIYTNNTSSTHTSTTTTHTPTPSNAILTLNTIKQHYDKEVVLPLYEINQCIKYHIRGIKDMYTIQSELINGPCSDASEAAGMYIECI